MITKEKFCSYINYIEFLLVLVDEDRNQSHIKSILNLIHKSFPKDENGFSHVEHHIFDLDFKNNEIDLEHRTPEELYNYLLNIEDNEKKI